MLFKKMYQEFLERLRFPDTKLINSLFKLIVITNVLGIVFGIKYSDANMRFHVITKKISTSRYFSRLYGSLCSIELPLFLRSFAFTTYSWLFRVDLSELSDPLDTYPTFSAFLGRKLKLGVRKIDESALVAPCDGRVISLGKVTEQIYSIKGCNYLFSQLLAGKYLPFKEYRDSLVKDPENELYFLTIYLSPGDCHRFYAPCDWEVVFRRHIYGYLQGLFEWNLLRKQEVFSHNERVAYFGKWKFGALHYIAIAAFGLGDVSVLCDQDMKTNLKDFESPEKMFDEKQIGKKMSKGEEFGAFNAGSSIVVVFEGPGDLKWAVGEGDRVKLGTKIISEV